MRFLWCRASLLSFFTAYDALYEEGLAENVTQVLNDIADTSVPGAYILNYIACLKLDCIGYWLCDTPATMRFEDIQGQILEGLVARIVAPQCVSSLVRFPRPQGNWLYKKSSCIKRRMPFRRFCLCAASSYHGKQAREICYSNRHSERKVCRSWPRTLII